MVFAYGTMVRGPTEFKPIEQYRDGDHVLAATMAPGGPHWTPREVAFSQGAGPSPHQSMMVYMVFGETESLIVTTDQIFLMKDGKLKRAADLVPESDFLTSEDGAGVPIREVRFGDYAGGVHAISASPNEWQGSMDDHLLDCAGIIAGDFLLQTHGDEFVEKGGSSTFDPGLNVAGGTHERGGPG
jgi:hypothetical protein